MRRPALKPLSPASAALPWAVAVAFLGALAVQACTIPVFRYALDRWQPDAWRLVVPTAMAKQPEIAKLLVPFRGNAPANIRIEDGGAATEAKLFASYAPEKPLWSGALDAASLGALLESPARKELAKRILEGESVIWVIALGDKPEDAAAADRIEKRLKFLEQVVQIPPQDPDDPDSQLGPGPPLKLKLAVLRVKLSDPTEKIFCQMIAGPKCLAALAKGETFAAPVFGRGRVLGAWTATELDEAAIEDATMFLTGRCSCRVKNQSPGWDVLLKIDWDDALAKASVVKVASAPVGATTTAQGADGSKESADDEEFVVTDTTIIVEGVSWGKVAIIGGGTLGVLAASMLWFRR